jgi:hypothetical protein
MKTITISIPTELRVWVNALMTAAASGAIEAIVNYYEAGFDLSKVDFHKMGQVAGAGAAIAIVNHFRKPPAEKIPAQASSVQTQPDASSQPDQLGELLKSIRLQAAGSSLSLPVQFALGGLQAARPVLEVPPTVQVSAN